MNTLIASHEPRRLVPMFSEIRPQLPGSTAALEYYSFTKLPFSSATEGDSDEHRTVRSGVTVRQASCSTAEKLSLLVNLRAGSMTLTAGAAILLAFIASCSAQVTTTQPDPSFFEAVQSVGNLASLLPLNSCSSYRYSADTEDGGGVSLDCRTAARLWPCMGVQTTAPH